MKPLTSEDFPYLRIVPQDVSPSIQATVNGYWRSVQTSEYLQAAWHDLQAQLAIDRTANPLMHDATCAWAASEIQAIAKARGIDNPTEPLDLGSVFTFLGDTAAAPPRELIKKTLPADGVAVLGGQSSAGKTFLEIHKAICLATPLPFFGNKIVERVGTVLVAAEGRALIPNRFAAALAAAVHHYGKNAESGLRGASAWRGSADVVLGALADIDPLTVYPRDRQSLGY